VFGSPFAVALLQAYGTITYLEGPSQWIGFLFVLFYIGIGVGIMRGSLGVALIGLVVYGIDTVIKIISMFMGSMDLAIFGWMIPGLLLRVGFLIGFYQPVRYLIAIRKFQLSESEGV
jgi:hypothetical protein